MNGARAHGFHEPGDCTHSILKAPVFRLARRATVSRQIKCNDVVIALQGFNLPVPIRQVKPNCMNQYDGFRMVRSRADPVQWRVSIPWIFFMTHPCWMVKDSSEFECHLLQQPLAC